MKKQRSDESISDPFSRMNQLSLSNPKPIILPSISTKRDHPVSPSDTEPSESLTSQRRELKKSSSKQSSSVESSSQQLSTVESSSKSVPSKQVPTVVLSQDQLPTKPSPLQSQKDLQLRVDTVVSQRSIEMIQEQITEIDSSTLILTTHERCDTWIVLIGRVRHTPSKWSVLCQQGIIRTQGIEHLFGRCVCSLSFELCLS